MNGIDVSHGARITLSRSTGENGQKSLSTATGNDVRRQHRPANFNTPQSRSVSCLNTVSTGAQTIQGGQGDTLISTGAAEGTFIGGAGNTLIDARYYRIFTSDYAWNAIGSALKLDFGWQASSTYRTHAA